MPNPRRDHLMPAVGISLSGFWAACVLATSIFLGLQGNRQVVAEDAIGRRWFKQHSENEPSGSFNRSARRQPRQFRGGTISDPAKVFRESDTARFTELSRTEFAESPSHVVDTGYQLHPVVQIVGEHNDRDLGKDVSTGRTRTALTGSRDSLIVRAQNGSVFGSNVRLRFDYADDFGDDNRIRGHLLMGLGRQLAVDAEAIWHDHTTTQRLMDTFWTGDVNLIYRLNTQRINLRFGGGASYRILNGDADFGYNLTYSTDFFISRPWLVSAEVDWGQIQGEDLFHWRATVGYMLGILEAYAGYDSWELGSLRFKGPVAGLGLTF